MKTAIKLALLGAALVGGAAQAATFNTPVTSVGGSDLELFVSDTTTGSYFAQDLGNQLDTIYSKAQVISDGVQAANTPGAFNAPTSISGLDSNLAAFLGGTHAGDNVVWTMMAADRSVTTIGLGAERAMLTSTLDLSGAVNNSFSNLNVSSFAQNLNTFTNNLNTLYAGANTSTGGGYSDGSATTDGQKSPLSWISASLGNGATIGTAQTLYLFASNGAGSGVQANAYVGGTISINGAGDITVTNASTAPVPLPAAVWLLGSGLLGLLGVGRRRAA